MPGKTLKPEEEFVLDAAFGRVESARKGLDQARTELGSVMRALGLAASARHLKRTRQWALQVAKEAEKSRREAGNAEIDSSTEDLAESIRRLGILEPIVVEAIDDELLRVVDGHRRLRVAREAGLSRLTVSLLVRRPTAVSAERRVSGPALAEQGAEQTAGLGSNVGPAEDAARDHRRIRFMYKGLEGEARERTVDVWGVVWRSGLLYLVGFDQDRTAIRTFRVDRILGTIEDLGQGGPPPEGFSAERNVWSQLDPEVMEAMQATFRKVFIEMNRRRTIEDWLELDSTDP